MSLLIKGLYRHYKGNIYVIESIAHLESSGETMVVYRPLVDTKQYVRPKKEFQEILPGGIPRFERMEQITVTHKHDNFT